MSTFTIRPASIQRGDHELFLDLWDSQLPWLYNIGSSGQWGSQAIREARPEAADKVRKWIMQSESQSSWGPDWCRAFVAEVTRISTQDGNDSEEVVAVAAISLESKPAAYTASMLSDEDDTESFAYISFLMSNRNEADLARGAGSALIRHAKEHCLSHGIRRLCLDCYRGNDRKLVKYYEKQGFRLVQDFTAGDKDWPGSVLERRI